MNNSAQLQFGETQREDLECQLRNATWLREIVAGRLGAVAAALSIPSDQVLDVVVGMLELSEDMAKRERHLRVQLDLLTLHGDGNTPPEDDDDGPIITDFEDPPPRPPAPWAPPTPVVPPTIAEAAIAAQAPAPRHWARRLLDIFRT